MAEVHLEHLLTGSQEEEETVYENLKFEILHV
jgi:hypothetical protein